MNNNRNTEVRADVVGALTPHGYTFEDRDSRYSDGKRLFVDVGAEHNMVLEFTKANWKLNHSEGVQVTVKAPSSKPGSYGYVDQTRTFRTGKDGVSLNLGGIVKAVHLLAIDMCKADEGRKAEQERDAAKDDLREDNRTKLVMAGLLPAHDPEFACMPLHETSVKLQNGIEAELQVKYNGPVSIEIKGLTAEQAIALLGKM